MNISKETPFEYDTEHAVTPALAKIDDTHYLCVYTGPGSDGWAVVLTVDTGMWTISAGTKFMFDDSGCANPVLAQIDTNNYLCAYSGSGSDGWAVVLAVESDTWIISKGVSLEFDTSKGTHPALAQIDQDDYLCVYEDSNVDGQAFVLTYNPAAGPPVSP